MLTNEQPSTGILEEFRLEFRDFWQRLPDKALLFSLLIAWVALFHFIGNSTLGYVHSPSLLIWMYSAYHATQYEDGHGTLVPFVVLGLMWWKRKELIQVPFRTWSPALVLIGLGLIFHLLGYGIQQPRLSIMGLFIGIYGIMGLAWGPSFLRASFFPFCLLAFCVPLGTQALPITFRLRLLVCQIVEFISHYILQIDIIRDGTAIKDPTNRYQYEVAAACSGIRSLISIAGLAIIYGMFAFRSWWKRAVMFASAVPLAVFGNTLRMLSIVIAAEIGGKDGQSWGNYVHEGGPLGIFSLLPYILAFLGLFALGYWLGDKKVQPPSSAGAVPQNA